MMSVTYRGVRYTFFANLVDGVLLAGTLDHLFNSLGVNRGETYNNNYMTLIDKAAHALAAEYGPDWYQKIDLNRLDMDAGSDCIIGQLTGAWVVAESSNRPCFTSLTDEEYEEAFSGQDYNGIISDEEWKAYIITARRSATSGVGTFDFMEAALIKQLLTEYYGPYASIAAAAAAKL